VAQEVGASDVSIREWIRRYQEYGRAGLEAPIGSRAKAAKPKFAAAWEAGDRGGEEAASQLRGAADRPLAEAALFLPASPETVRRTLHQHQLLPKTKPRR
jgi:transposase